METRPKRIQIIRPDELPDIPEMKVVSPAPKTSWEEELGEALARWLHYRNSKNT